ncbi:hypothetical protein CPB85DRAFT_1432081 [Mucidula mucida]|nr:hypothetical protein CPB85DRAFT_1432081 [Mucidula mucida]
MLSVQYLHGSHTCTRSRYVDDILFGLWGIHTKAFSGPSDTQFISLTDDSRRTPYSDERRMRHIRQLVLCRDVVCGVLPGPSPMTMRGAYTTYLRPVLSVSRQLYGFWAALPSQESAELENYIKTFFIVTYEERMDWCKDFQLMALHTMMNHVTDLHKRYFSRDSTA